MNAGSNRSYTLPSDSQIVLKPDRTMLPIRFFFTTHLTDARFALSGGARWLALAGVALMLTGCYSFTGASLPPHIKTVSVPLFADESRSGVPQLRERLTTKMVEKVQAKSGLLIQQEKQNANSVLECIVTTYSNLPSNISGTNERATRNRVSIGITAKYRDLVKNKKMFEQAFNGFADYPVGDLAEQQKAIDAAIELATEDILNKIVSGW